MVFKVKQRAKKDFDNYKKVQIATAIRDTILNDAQGDGVITSLGGEYKNIINKRTIGNIFGANWPYDYFSLIESMKINIDFEVSG